MDDLKPTQHWFIQRFSAVGILIATIIWVCFFLSKSGQYHDLIHCFKNPLVLAFVTLTFAGIMFHAFLGVQVVCQDYIHCAGMRRFALSFVGTLFILMFHWLVFCLVKIVGLT